MTFSYDTRPHESANTTITTYCAESVVMRRSITRG